MHVSCDVGVACSYGDDVCMIPCHGSVVHVVAMVMV